MSGSSTCFSEIVNPDQTCGITVLFDAHNVGPTTCTFVTPAGTGVRWVTAVDAAGTSKLAAGAQFTYTS